MRWLRSWLRSLDFIRDRRRKLDARRSRRPSLEGLEERVVPAASLAPGFTPLALQDANISSLAATAVDSAGNIYVTGEFTGTFTIGSTQLTAQGSFPDGDAFVAKFTAAGVPVWAVDLGGANGNVQGNGIVVDASGNVDTTGFFSGTADFDPAQSNPLGVLTSSGGGVDQNAFVLQLDTNGNFVWADDLGGTGTSSGVTVSGNSIALDSSGNIYTTGFFFGAADFDPAGTNAAGQITSSVGGTGQSAYVSKLTSSGGFVWADDLGFAAANSGANAFGQGIAVASGTVYTTGSFTGAGVDFNPSDLTGASGGVLTSSSSGGDTNAFVATVNAADGSFTAPTNWAVSLGGGGTAQGNSIAVDASGNVYSTGSFSSGTDPSDFTAGTGTSVSLASGGGGAITGTSDSDGLITVSTSNTAGLANNDTITITNSLDPNANNSFTISGLASNSFQLEGSTPDGTFGAGGTWINDNNGIYVSKLDNNGNSVWAEQLGLGSEQFPLSSYLALNAQGDVYVTGNFTGTGSFNTGTGTQAPLTSSSSGIDENAYVVELDGSGNSLDVSQLGFDGTNAGSNATSGTGLAVAPSGEVALVGNLLGTGNFDPASQGTGDNDAVLTDTTSFNATFLVNLAEPLILGAASTTTGRVEQPFSSTIAINNGQEPFTITNLAAIDAILNPLDLSAAVTGDTITISGTPNAAATIGPFTIDVQDANGVTGSASYTITIENAADVTVTNTADASSVDAGGNAGFTVVLDNVGTGQATGLTFSDPLPGTGVVSWVIDPTSPDAASFSISGSPGSQSLVLNGVTTLDAVSTLTVHIEATTVPSTTLDVPLDTTATVSAGNEDPSVQNQTASAEEDVLSPEVTISKTADAASVDAGGAVGFTVTIDNVGEGTANGVTFSDSLPSAGVGSWSIDTSTGDPGSFSISGSPGSQSLVLNGVSSLAAGTSLTVHVIGTSVPNTTTTVALSNTATVSADNEDPSFQSASESATEDVLSPDVTITKTADAASVVAGGTAGFTVTITNTGAGTANGLTFSDPLPSAGVGSWSIDTSTGDFGSFTITGSAGSQSLALNGVSSLAAGASLSVHITAATVGTTTLTQALANTATVSATNEDLSFQNASDSATENVLSPDVTITKTPDAASVTAGGTAGFTVTISNTGTGTANGLTFSDPLPSAGVGSWSIDTSTGDFGSFTITGSAGSQSLALNGVSSLAAGDSLTVHVVATTVPSTTLTQALANTATVSATNEDPSFQSAQASATENVLSPDVVIFKTADAASVSAGGTAGFTVTISNTGTGTANGLTFSDPLPSAGVGSWSIDTTTGNFGSFTITGSAGSQSLALNGVSSLAAGASLSVHITAATVGTTTLTQTLANTATVSATNEDPSFQSAQASASENVLSPDVTITKTADAANVSAGGTAGFTVTISNTGTGTANGLTFSDPLPSTGVGSWSIDTSTGNFASFKITGSAGSQSLALNGVSSLAAGASLTVHVTAITVGGTTLTQPLANTATVSATNEDPSLQSAQASATENVLSPDVTITKTADAASVTAGGTAGFTVTISNTGTGTANGLTFSDPLPSAGVGSWSIDTSTGNFASFTITGPAGSQSLALNGVSSLAAGASLTVHVTAITVGGTTLTQPLANAATVSASNENPSFQSAQASATENVLSPKVTVTKTADAASVVAGGTAGFTVTISNVGPGTANGLTFSDPLPAAGVQSWSIDTSTGNFGSFTITGSAGSQSLGLNGISTLAAGISLTVHVTATTVPGTTLTQTLANTAMVSASNEAPSFENAQASATENVLSPDVTVTKTSDAASVSAGARDGYTVTIHNAGAGTANGLSLSDPLPALGGSNLWSIDTSTGNFGSFTITGSAGSQSLALNGVSSLAAGVTLTVHITGITAPSATASLALHNTATVSASNEAATFQNDQATSTITVLTPDLTISKTHTGSFFKGEIGATYTIVVSNAGPGTTSGTVTVTDVLPTGLTATSLTGTGWTIVHGSGGTVEATRSNALGSGASYAPLTLTVNVSTSAPASVTNTARVSGGNEFNTANDSSSDVTAISQVIATSIQLLSQISNATLSQATAPFQVKVLDQLNHPLIAGSVTISLIGASGANLGSLGSFSVVNGIATISGLKFNTAGSFRLLIQSGSAAIFSNPFTVLNIVGRHSPA